MKGGRQGPLTEGKWDANRWRRRCAWCGRKVKAEDPVFAISVRLEAAALRELAPGSVAPLLLAKEGRVVAMMVVGEESPAKREGKDAVFRLCSEDCALALQRVLREELGAGGDATVVE